MKAVKISEGVVPVGEFKANTATWIEVLNTTGNPIVITQHGKPAAVLVTPREFDRIQYKEAFLASIDEGVAELNAGKGVKMSAVEKRLENRIKKSKSK